MCYDSKGNAFYSEGEDVQDLDQEHESISALYLEGAVNRLVRDIL